MRVTGTPFRAFYATPAVSIPKATPLQPDAGCQSNPAVAIRSVVRFHLPSLYPHCFIKAFLTATLSPTNCRRSHPVFRTFCPLELVVTKSFRRCQFRQSGTTAAVQRTKSLSQIHPAFDASMQIIASTLCTQDVKAVKDTLMWMSNPMCSQSSPKDHRITAR